MKTTELCHVTVNSLAPGAPGVSDLFWFLMCPQIAWLHLSGFSPLCLSSVLSLCIHFLLDALDQVRRSLVLRIFMEMQKKGEGQLVIYPTMSGTDSAVMEN